MLLANPLCGALSQSSLWGCGCGCMSESASVQCCNTAGHRHLGNFPVKSQCVSIGYLGLLVFFIFPVRCPPVSFPFMSAERGGRGWEMLQGTPKLLEEPSHSHDRWSLQRWARFPGHSAWGHREGKPSHLGQLWLQGAPSTCCSSSQKFDLFFERTGEIINHSWWRQSWAD